MDGYREWKDYMDEERFQNLEIDRIVEFSGNK